MKPYLLSLLALIASTTLQGQTAKLYPDAASFKNGLPIVLEPVSRSLRTKMDIKSNGGGMYKLTTPDKKKSKGLRDKYWAVEYDSMLLVNCKTHLHTNGYAPVLYRSPDFLYFRAVANKKHMGAVAVGGMAFGAVGGLAVWAADRAVSGSHYKDGYLTYLEWGETMLLTEKSFASLLKMRGDTALLRQYQAEGDPTDTAIYFKYLRAMSRK